MSEICILCGQRVPSLCPNSGVSQEIRMKEFEKIVERKVYEATVASKIDNEKTKELLKECFLYLDTNHYNPDSLYQRVKQFIKKE
jgi:hypothetical protein